MRLTALLPLIALTGCGVGVITAPGTSRAPEQVVRVSGVPQPVRLGGEVETTRQFVGLGTVPRHDLSLRVNGVQAIRGTLDTYGTTNLAGRAGELATAATCVSRELAKADRQFDCAVQVNGQSTTTLSFRASPSGPQQVVASR